MSRKIFLPILFLFFSVHIFAQDISSVDFKNLKAEDLTNEQIIQLFERAQSQGLSIQELETLALARGMAPAEVSKLRSRFNNLRSGENTPQSEINTTQERLREGEDDTQIARTSTVLVQDEELKVFGSTLFTNENLTFEPSQNIPTPKNYVLGAGDELLIDIYGASENSYRLTISPEGLIQVSKVGLISVSGLTIEEASKRIKSRLSKIHSGLSGSDPDTFAQITLGNIRTIKVHILGEVNLPGTYNLSSLSTVFNALYVSGGPSSNGTYRSIKVIRGSKVEAEIDLYDFLIQGDQSGNIVLQDQDILKVDPYINRVSVNGETKRQGLFETKSGETFDEVLLFAGGFNQQAYKQRVKIRRNTDTEKRIVEIKYPEEKDTELKSGDEITIGKILDRYANRVEIQGAVFREGEYELEDNPSLLTLIENADGVLGDAYLERVIIYRTNDDYTVSSIPVNLKTLLAEPDNDIRLKKDDIIRISSIFDLREDRSITISGEVNDGGTFPFIEKMTLKDLVFQAKGFTDRAAPYNIEIARRILDDGTGILRDRTAEIFSLEVKEGLVLDEAIPEFELFPFDRVFVRSSPSYQDQKTVRITGQVLFPGTYVIENRDFRISDLIDKAGGITQYAYTDGASLTRQFKDLDEEEVDSIQTINQVGIQLNEIMKKPNSDFDLLLFPGDVIDVPVKLETVSIQGEVLFPINVRYQNQKGFKSYLNSAGGLSFEADGRKAYIVYANGEVDRVKKFLFFKRYPNVKPGSMIYVPKKQEKQRISTSERIAIYSTIVSVAAIVTNTIFQIRNTNNSSN